MSISRAKDRWLTPRAVVLDGNLQPGNFVRRGGKTFLLRRNKK